MITQFKIYENSFEISMFQIGTYWRFKNKIQDSIFKVIGKNDTHIIMEIFILVREGKPHEKFIKLDFDYADMKKFAVENYEGKIFRKATNEEIEKYLMSKETQKYNL